MNIHQNSLLRRAAVIAATALTMLSATMSPADAGEPVMQIERSVQVQRTTTAPKCATGTLTPSGTHCYLPAVVTPATTR